MAKGSIYGNQVLFIEASGEEIIFMASEVFFIQIATYILALSRMVRPMDLESIIAKLDQNIKASG